MTEQGTDPPFNSRRRRRRGAFRDWDQLYELSLYTFGWNDDEIAQELGITDRQVRRDLRIAREHVADPDWRPGRG